MFQEDVTMRRMTLMAGSLPAVLVAGLLASCVSGPQTTDSPFFQPPVHSTLVVHEAIKIPAGRASVFLQGGRWSGGGFNHYEPHCLLRVRDVSDAPQWVQPDRFDIVRVVRDQPFVIALQAPGYASDGSGDTGIPVDLISVVEMTLHSIVQPHVLSLACGGSTADPSDVVPPSIDEMRAALGSMASLEIERTGR